MSKVEGSASNSLLKYLQMDSAMVVATTVIADLRVGTSRTNCFVVLPSLQDWS